MTSLQRVACLETCSGLMLCELVALEPTRCLMLHLDESHPVLEFSSNNSHAVYIHRERGEQSDLEGILPCISALYFRLRSI